MTVQDTQNDVGVGKLRRKRGKEGQRQGQREEAQGQSLLGCPRLRTGVDSRPFIRLLKVRSIDIRTPLCAALSWPIANVPQPSLDPSIAALWLLPPAALPMRAMRSEVVCCSLDVSCSPDSVNAVRMQAARSLLLPKHCSWARRRLLKMTAEAAYS